MFTCLKCGGIGRRRPRTFFERFTKRAKVVCSDCGDVWYWRRVPFQTHVQCPDCGTLRLSKRSKYDRIDRKSDSILRKFLGIFGAPIYHCTFCRLQFRDYHSLDPKATNKARASA